MDGIVWDWYDFLCLVGDIEHLTDYGTNYNTETLVQKDLQMACTERYIA